ncbi:double-strand break repair helicase AddA [Roseobacter sp. HKCCA0434]|uniref:double-strand break repair helicase AddA n=1 Tax=Roseobacter sp. HKCCA0434 TaxID=3079297 RepID=UPI002905C440|nr:double-strand break repair helicase AddA [Roseobacter sp. HKCCA0434]
MGLTVELSAASRAQNRASDPAGSAWVGANAGSGKTRVLTDRVARLLLHGAAPEHILCLTYTKAAAAEMKNRLFARLGAWSMMPDAKLRAELAALEETGEVDLAHARQLFARALETPGELKIQTIHAFCGTILRRFPLEAGVSPGFREIDEPEAQALQADLMDRIAEEEPEVFAALARHCPGDGPQAVIEGILKERDAFAEPLDQAALEAALELDPLATSPVVDDADRALLARLAEVMAEIGSPAEQRDKLPKVVRALNADTPDKAVAALEEVALFGSGAKDPFGPKPFAGVNKPTAKALAGDEADRLTALAERVAEARRARLARALIARTQALHDFARAFLDRYDAAKAEVGALDFEDLIRRTHVLLTQPGIADWVLYKLDGGIEHILVDEAQDTSPLQWQVIEALTPEFYAGEGVERAERTLFVVGDQKQSIYSFQGAQPASFGRMRDLFRDRLDAAGKPFAPVALDVSFRSAAPILRLTDAVFAVEGRGGVAEEVRHEAFAQDKPGRVDLWPFLESEKDDSEGAWYDPVDMPSADRADLRLARIIARQVAAMLRAGTPMPGEDGARPLRPSDILILFRSRGPMFHALIYFLKDEGVPVAGADRMKLGDELAVLDLLALMRFAVTPDDDLSLAAALRSPLFEVDEDALFRLAHDRGRTRLLARLQDDPAHADAAALLQDLRDESDFIRPYEFLERILIRHDGRRRMVARLGPQAAEALDELLNQALAYERTEAPTLGGFLDWLTPDTLEIKRELDEGGGAVRIMTVHGAKGLEAPVVILPQTGRWDSHGAPLVLDTPLGPVWRETPQTAFEDGPVAAKKEDEQRERERLLYVALTRAEHWLIVAGAGNRGKSASSWYDLVEAGLATLDPVEADAIEGLDGSMRRLDHLWPAEETTTPEAGQDTPSAAPPGWEIVAPPKAESVLRPSDLGGAHALPGEGDETALALLRGEVIHHLLDHLPRAADPDILRDTALARLPEDLRAAVVAEVDALLAEPDLAPLFGPDALAEAAVAGRIGGHVLTGRVDRLVRLPDRVLVADFKSNRVVPASVEDTPEALLRQMGAYLAVLGPAFDPVPVELALVWTATGRMDVLPHALVTAALGRVRLP